MLRILDEFYQAFKLAMLKELSRRLSKLAQRLALWSMCIFWYTYETENPNKGFISAPAILHVNAKKSLKNSKVVKKRRK
jgi:hypothetical protein